MAVEETKDEPTAAALVEQAPDAMIYADSSGTIRVWNAAATRVFGHSAEAAVGAKLDMIIPEQFRDAHWKGFQRAMAEGVTKYSGQSLATKSVTASGAAIYAELRFAIVLDDRGEAIGALAQARDITERFESDRQLRRRLKQLEAELRNEEA